MEIIYLFLPCISIIFGSVRFLLPHIANSSFPFDRFDNARSFTNNQQPMHYTRLDSEPDLPREPPTYDNISMEEFEIEDSEPVARELLLFRASLATKKFTFGFKQRVLVPVARMMDPVCEGYNYFDSLFERLILKAGNPLVVKRLLYVAFMLGIIFYITHALVFEEKAVSGTTGGTFYLGHFFDVDLLGSKLQQYINTASMEENLHYLSQPRIAGTVQDLDSAKYVHQWFELNGLLHVQTMDLPVHINYPQPDGTYLKVGDWQATLYEPGNGTDPVLPYHAWLPNGMSSGGEVKGGLVFAGLGSQEEFSQLDSAGVSLENKVVLVTMGGWPELEKVAQATNRHAAALCFISDKGKDGTAISRVNVGRVRELFGNVVTPDWSHAQRGFVAQVPWEELPVTPKIPTLPLSHNDGHALLKKIGGSGVEIAGKHSGDGTVEARLNVSLASYPTQKVWNVIGSIPGREVTGQAVIIGAGRDSLSSDVSGLAASTTVLLELVRSLTVLQRMTGWTPARLVYFLLWDATNYNLAGVTDWVEYQREDLKRQGFVYMDINDVVAGPHLEVKSHPLLRHALSNALGKVKAASGKTLYEEYQERHLGSGDFLFEMIEERNYIPFINALNIPLMELKFVGDDGDLAGTCANTWQAFVSHSIDNDMHLHKSAVLALGQFLLEVVESPFIPYDVRNWATKLRHYRDRLEFFINDIIKKNPETMTPVIHYDKLDEGISKLMELGEFVAGQINSWEANMAQFNQIEAPALRMFRMQWNEILMEFNERFLTDVKEELGRTMSYRNVLFGPAAAAPAHAPTRGKHDEGANSFPVVRDYVYLKDWGRVQLEIDRLGALIYNAATN